MLQSAPGRAAMQARAIAAIDAAAADLRRVSAQIHDWPELNFEERHAHDVLTTAAAAAGLTVQRGAFDLPTAFSASAGAGGHRVAICCEYDALPEIGHACGHNLIAAAGLGAGIGAAAGLAASGAAGRVVVLGTPAEEGGGGKIELIARGAFEDVDAALMAHPAPSDLLRPGVSALQQMDVVYRGRNAHAAGAPWEGRNALDAMVIAYSAISALRQQLPPGALVHGVITHGGDKPNIIPSLTRAEFIVRARDRRELARLKERVLACFRAGAEASGCTVEVQQRGHEYLDMRHNAPIVDAYAANLRDLGAPPREDPGGFSAFSTDMGNVSYVTPSIHPVFGIPAAAGNHTPEFTAAAAAAPAQDAMLVAAKAMALTALDLLTDPGLLARARADFAADCAAGKDAAP